MSKDKFIELFTKESRRWINLDCVLIFEQATIIQKSHGTKVPVNAFILKGFDGSDEYEIAVITEFEEKNFKKVQRYLLG